jgi:hypothetical protein
MQYKRPTIVQGVETLYKIAPAELKKIPPASFAGGRACAPTER